MLTVKLGLLSPQEQVNARLHPPCSADVTDTPNTQARTPITLVTRLFVPFALGYFLSQHFRTVNAVISPDLARDTGINATQLGTVTGVYFLAFAAAQLPLGLLLDRFGPRQTAAGLLIFATAGAALFAGAENFWQLASGRFLIGFGVSCCMVAAFKAFATWVPMHMLPLANGCLMASGGLGILASTIPVEAALRLVDWRGVYYALAGGSLLVSALVYFVIPDKESEARAESFSEQMLGLLEVLKSSYFWRVVPLVVAVEGGIAGFYTLWAGPWLRDVAGFDRGEIANALFLIALAMIAGFPFFGYLASRLSKFGIGTLPVNVFGMSTSILLFALVMLQLTDLFLPALMLLMFCSTSTILVFAAMSQYFPQGLGGRVHTALNLLIFLGAFAAQFSIGAILDRFDSGAETERYSLEGYLLVGKIFVAWQVASLFWYLASGLVIKTDDSKTVLAPRQAKARR